MNHSTSLQRTQKGEDEVARRAYKLSLKKRSVLILLDKPRTIECILRKSLFPHDEMVEEIRALLRDAFVAIDGEGARPAGANGGAAAVPALGGGLDLDADISMSEAKFLLVDFCVDHFGTQSQALIDEIRACGGEKELSFCLGKAFAAVERQCPDQLPALLALVKKINETA
jgi:hypothetical protein